MSRTQYAAKNIFFGVLSKLSNLLFGFLSRTVFLYYLGATYLGISGLYTSVLSVLSFAELGFGTALTFAMYKPIAEEDTDKIVKLLQFYRGVYRIIALVVTTFGIAVLPLLPYIVKGADSLTLFELRLYFLIYLTNTVVSYFVSYKFSYLNGIQKNYIVTNIEAIINFVIICIQVLVIIITKNFLAYLLTHTVLLCVSRFLISIYLNKKCPIFTEKKSIRLSKEERAPIFKEVKGLMVHRFADVAVHSTDNIIISSLSGLGVVAVGLVSNYNLIITSVVGFISIIFTTLTSGFGNLVATTDDEHYHQVFLEFNFLNFWIYGFCAIAFFVLLPSFIVLWLGKNYLIDTISFLFIIIDCYLQGQSVAYNSVRVAKGNFAKDKWVVLGQALVNLIVSVIAAKYLGLLGVYIGTVCSRLVTIIFRPFMTYRFLFSRSSFEYYKRLIGYFLLVVIAGTITYLITIPLLESITLGSFVIAALLVVLIPNLIFLLCFGQTKLFRALVNRFVKFIKRKKEN